MKGKKVKEARMKRVKMMMTKKEKKKKLQRRKVATPSLQQLASIPEKNIDMLKENDL